MAIEFRRHHLPNGLTIVAECDDAAHSSACGFFVKTGARDEAHEIMGVSHFLEHMMFKGSDRLSAEALNLAFDEIGARNNAYTTHELTAFHAHVLPERVGEALDLLAEMMRPALRDDDFTREKQVILEEIAMYKDEPFWVLYEEALQRHFGAHPMGHRVLGTNETITALTRDGMRRYFDGRYSADNTTLALAGRIDFDAVVARVGERCGDWQRTGASRDAAPPRTGAGEFTMRDAKVTRAYLLGLADAPAISDERRYAATLLGQVLGTPDNSRFHWALVEPGLAEEAQASYGPHDGLGQLYVFAACDPDRVDEVWSIMVREVAGVADSVTEDDLERLRNKLATSVTVGGERPADRMQRLGQQWTYLAKYTRLEEELDRINRVSIADIREVARAFPPMPTTVGRLVPAK